MANKNKRTNGMRLVSLALLAQLVTASGFTALSASLSFNGGFRVPGTLAAEHDTTVSQSISLTDSNEFLRYLKLLDTESGRAAFDATHLAIQREGETLQKTRKNAVTLITDRVLLDSKTARTRSKFAALLPLFNAAPAENPTFLDLRRRIEGELRVDALFEQKIALSQNLALALEQSQLIHNIPVLEKLIVAQEEAIGLLSTVAPETDFSLLARLHFDRSLTEFWLKNAVIAQSFLGQAKAVRALDTTFLAVESAREKAVSDLILTLYPTDGDQQAQSLSDEALDLFRFYEKGDVSLSARRLEATVSLLEQISSEIGAISSLDPFNHHEAHLQALDSLLGGLTADPQTADSTESRIREYLTQIQPESETEFSADESLRRQLKLTENLDGLLPLTIPPFHIAQVEEEALTEVLLDGVERALKRQVSALPPVAAPSPSLEPSPPEVPEGSIPAEAASAETPAEQPLSEIPAVSVPLESTDAPVVEILPVPVPEAPATEAPVQPAPASEMVLPSSEITIPVELPVAFTASPAAEGPTSDFIKSVSGQVPILGSVMEILNVVTGPAQALLNAMESSEAPAPSMPSESLKAVAPADVNKGKPILSEPSPSEKTDAPQAETPTSKTPVAEMPATDVPAAETVAPIAEAPATEPSSAKAPEALTETPAAEVPAAETLAPDAEAPVTETPVAEIPVTETPSTETPPAEVPVPEIPLAEVPVPEISPAEVPVPEIQAPTQTLPSLEEITQGVQDFFSEALAVSSAIAQDPGINTLDQALQANAKTEGLALRISGLLDQIDALRIKPSNFNKILNSLSLSVDTLDELTSFLNQTTLKLGLADIAADFAGVNGVLRFGDEACPDIAKAKTLVPEDEKDDFLSQSLDRQRELLILEKEKDSDPETRRLMEFRRLKADFCFATSDDISTKNLVGQPDATRQSADSVVVDHENVTLSFGNDFSRSLTLDLRPEGGKSFSFAIRHLSPEDNGVLASLLQQKISTSIQTAIEGATGEVLKVETPADVPAALDEAVGNPQAYALYSLENPSQPSSSADTFQRVAAYEQNSHRKNIVTLFTDDAHRIAPRQIREHTIYNFGNGFETETIAFDGAVLRLAPDGQIEGYFFDPAAVRRQLLASAGDTVLSEDEILARIQGVLFQVHTRGMVHPDFLISEPFALDRNSQFVEGVGTTITGENFNQLSVVMNLDPKLYPTVLRTGLSLVTPGQTAYDRLFKRGDASEGRFGSSAAFGDFNGDGKKDVAIGSPTANGNRGLVAIYHSNDTAMIPEGDPDTVIEGAPSSFFGARLLSGDLNGDGVDDLAVGSPFYDNARGRVWVFHTLLADLKLSQTSSLGVGEKLLAADQANLILTGSGASDEFGTSLAIADLTGDGKNDLAIASPAAQNSRGSVYLYDNDAVAQGGSLNAEESIFKLSGDANAGGRFGASIATGDLDHDGTVDLAIGAPSFALGILKDTGHAYLFLQNAIPWTSLDVPCQRNCSAENSDRAFEGEASESHFGAAIAAGDLDGDGKDDLAVSANRFSVIDELENGRAYGFRTQDSGFRTQEQGAPVSAREADLKITGNSGEHLGSALLMFRLAGEGGLLVGSRDCDGLSGCAHLYTLPLLSKTLREEGGFTDADASHGLMWKGFPLGRFGESMAAADVDGDGFTDFAIGAPGDRSSAGASYFFRGVRSAMSIVPAEVPIEIPLSVKRPEEVIPTEETKPAAEEQPTEEIKIPEPEFTLQLQDIDEAVLETSKPGFALDVTVPETPEIDCPGFQSGVTTRLNAAACSWSDTAGPSAGIYRYCVDNENVCQPSTESLNRIAEIGQLIHLHTYLRVQTEDLGGSSAIATFDLKANHAPSFAQGPSDNGSDLTQPTSELDFIRFSATAQDQEGDSTRLLICRTSDDPVANDKGELECVGGPKNLYCTSVAMKNGAEASCDVKAKDEPLSTLIWYAFVCDTNAGAELCSPMSQGESVTGSPAVVKHPQTFDGVEVTDLAGQPIDPGDRLKFNLKKGGVQNVEVGKTITLFICSADTTVFDYQTNECMGGMLICSSSDVNPRTEDATCEDTTGNAPVPVPSAVGPMPFFVFVKHGEKGIAEGAHRQEYVVANTAPTLVSITNEGPLEIPGGGSTTVAFSATVRDTNGAADIVGAKGVLFDADIVGNRCTAHANDCVFDTACVVTPVGETNVTVDCSVEIFYNANASTNWKAHVIPVDSQGEYLDLPDSVTTRVVPPLTAINQGEVQLQYELTAPGQTSASAATALTNLGNQPVDVLISGTDLVSPAGTIPRANQLWSLSSDLDPATDGNPLVEVPEAGSTADKGCANVNLRVHDKDVAETLETVPVYWKVMIPKFLKADTYQGSVTFAQAPDNCLNPDSLD